MDAESFKNLTLDEQIKLALSSKYPKILDIIARSDCDAAKIYAARNKFTSGKSLDIMAHNTTSRTVFESLLGNLNLLPSTRAKLAKAS